MEIEKKPEIPSKKVSEHLQSIQFLIEENEIGRALDYLEWLLDKIRLHQLDEDVGVFE